jgi:DNA-binding HxlR family transcriptional regulator
MNPYNSDYKLHNQQIILLALVDGQWHRNMDLKEETKLTPRTLSKHLKELTNELHWIERKEDTESGEYPHPVLYRATEESILYTTYLMITLNNANKMEKRLKEIKDPLQILDEIHKLNELYFTSILENIQNSKYKTLKQSDSITGLFLHSPYNLYIRSLLKAFTKAVQFGAHFDFDKLRQKHEVWDDTDE